MEIDDLIKQLRLPPTVLRVSKHALDDEFEAHPDHVATAAVAKADAVRDRDEHKAFLTRIEGQVRTEKRKESDGAKVTVKDLDATIANDPEVRSAEKKLIELDHNVAMCDALVTALQAKTSALKHLSELWQTAYYTTNSGREPRRRVRDDG